MEFEKYGGRRMDLSALIVSSRRIKISHLFYIFHVWLPYGIGPLRSVQNNCSQTIVFCCKKGGRILQLLILHVEGRGNNWHVPHTLIAHMITLRRYNITSTVVKGSRPLVAGYNRVDLICLGMFIGFWRNFIPFAILHIDFLGKIYFFSFQSWVFCVCDISEEVFLASLVHVCWFLIHTFKTLTSEFSYIPFLFHPFRVFLYLRAYLFS